MTTSSPTNTATPMVNEQAFIAGEWRDSAGGARFEVLDPADQREICSVPDCVAGDAVAAVDAAQAALAGWKRLLAKERAGLLERWFDALMARQEDLAALISAEQGKPLAESRTEVAYGAAYVEWFSEEAKRAYGAVIPATAHGRKIIVVKEPVGVVAAITPWNFPLAMLARKIAPALAAGCTIVCKPAEDTPLAALAIARLAQQAGIPAGVINIVTASRAHAPQVVDAWLADPRVRKISFTGSTAVGKHLARESATTLKRLSLELGGNSPFIVFDDADIDRAVEGLLAAKFRNAGQTCVSPNRVFVHDSVHDAFAQKLTAAVRSLKVAAARDPSAQIGPLINEKALQKVDFHVSDAVAKGATVLTGGRRLGGLFYAPTVLSGVDASMALSCEETFGPVAALVRFGANGADDSEVIRRANDTPFGLAAYFYSRDVGRVWRVADALHSGMVAINEGILSTEVAPFGGVKESGYGREGSFIGMDDYLETKYVCQGGLAA